MVWIVDYCRVEVVIVDDAGLARVIDSFIDSRVIDWIVVGRSVYTVICDVCVVDVLGWLKGRVLPVVLSLNLVAIIGV